MNHRPGGASPGLCKRLCIFAGRRRRIPGSSSTRATRRPWPPSAARWTASRSRSSWPRRGSGCCRRSRQIAARIAAGHSNKDIAAELSISPTTAARHVANILAKLGFRSRTQIAAWAADQQ
jgi:DNA-binding NarL/FixJ family response regulator